MANVDIEGLLRLAASVATSKKGQSVICGKYSDGRPRSVIDAIRDEFISPEDRARWEKKKRKKKKKKKKKKNKSPWIV